MYDKNETNAPGSSFHLFILFTSNPIIRAIKHYWLLLLAMALGLVARLLWLSAHSVLLDEATVAIGARDIIQNHTPMWDAMSNAPFVWLIAHVLGKVGLANDFLLRLPSAIVGVASIAGVFWLARRMFDEKIAIASAFLFALHPFAVAFSRVLFADPFQVFFVLIGCYGFDKLATQSLRETPRKWMLLLSLCFVWGIAFIMKYNAIVPGAIWLVSGVISRRYHIVPAIAGIIAVALGSFATLLIWPYDETVWLLAFMGKAGSYNFVYAMDYYLARLHLVFFGITEILFVTAFVVVWLLRRKGDAVPNDRISNNVRTSKALLHLTAFLLLQTATLIMLGRMFERYLLVLVPFGCMLLVALVDAIPHLVGSYPNYWIKVIIKDGKSKFPQRRWESLAVYSALFAALFFFGKGACHSYSNYFDYLRNDVNYASLAHEVLSMEQQPGSIAPRRAFWLVPEPIAAYYLGYTQRYSRAVLPNRDGPTAYLNYFEFVGIPYTEDWRGDKVLAIRGLARDWGMARILTSPNHFIAMAKRAADSAQKMERLPIVDYLDSDFVRPNDMLIMQSGFTDLAGEPILENISDEGGPPFIPTLPLEHYSVYRVYRPDGLAPITDTTLERVKVGMWMMVKK